MHLVEHNGRATVVVMPNTVEKQCEECGNLFAAYVKEINRGYGRFCSVSCSSRHNHVGKTSPFVKCGLCGVSFQKRPSRVLLSKRGINFCCRKHKDDAQKMESGVLNIHGVTDHKGYRHKALRQLDNSCLACGYDRHVEVLVVHHVDHDRDNNSIGNLVVLCPTCHSERHLSDKNDSGPSGS